MSSVGTLKSIDIMCKRFKFSSFCVHDDSETMYVVKYELRMKFRIT